MFCVRGESLTRGRERGSKGVARAVHCEVIRRGKTLQRVTFVRQARSRKTHAPPPPLLYIVFSAFRSTVPFDAPAKLRSGLRYVRAPKQETINARYAG